VKVQHLGLREQATVDIQVVEGLIRAVHQYNPEIDYRWVADEMVRYSLRPLPLALSNQQPILSNQRPTLRS
jgi:hypothetical protein